MSPNFYVSNVILYFFRDFQTCHRYVSGKEKFVLERRRRYTEAKQLDN